MKKIYVLALALGAFGFSSYAQTELEDDFESYTLGDISAQSPHWRTWGGTNGGAEDADVTDSEAFSGFQSMHIDGSVITDELLLIPSAPISGVYSVRWYGYIPSGGGGYFNMQAAKTPDGQAWNQALMGGNVFFNCDGNSGGQGTIDASPAGEDCTVSVASFSYPEDEWFKVDCIYDIDNETWDMYVNDVQYIFDHEFAFNTQVFIELAAIDFYSATTHNDLYVDDVTLFNGNIQTASTDDFSAINFSVYPNPVKDVLNIQSKNTVDNVTVYDILGKVVLQEAPGKISPAINMSGLASGTYMVKVTIGNSSKTVKVLK